MSKLFFLCLVLTMSTLWAAEWYQIDSESTHICESAVKHLGAEHQRPELTYQPDAGRPNCCIILWKGPGTDGQMNTAAAEACWSHSIDNFIYKFL